MTLIMDKMEYINSIFREKLMAVAAEIFEVLKDTVYEYQEEVERTKQENRRLRNQLTEINIRSEIHTEDGQTSSQQYPQICTGTLGSLLQVKKEELPFTDYTNDYELSGCAIISDNSSSVVNCDREPENHVVGLRDGQVPRLSSQCQSQTAEIGSLSSYCRKSFRTRVQLKKHVAVRQKERPRPYRCDWCGKCYTSSQVLEVHHRTHTGERPYRCRICGRRFKQQNHLNDHERIHTGEKPFSCPVCGKRFVQSGHVRKHMNCHLPPIS